MLILFACGIYFSVIFIDEKEKYDPVAFRDTIIRGFNEAGNDLDKVSKYLDSAGNKLDYRRYAEALFDILFAGGLLGKHYILFPFFLCVNVLYDICIHCLVCHALLVKLILLLLYVCTVYISFRFVGLSKLLSK